MNNQPTQLDKESFFEMINAMKPFLVKIKTDDAESEIYLIKTNDYDSFTSGEATKDAFVFPVVKMREYFLLMKKDKLKVTFDKIPLLYKIKHHFYGYQNEEREIVNIQSRKIISIEEINFPFIEYGFDFMTRNASTIEDKFMYNEN